MDRLYYNEYYTLEREHWWFIIREQILSEQVRNIMSDSKEPLILNIGAATGKTSIMLANYGKVTSIEYDKECCELTKKRVGIDLLNASMTDLPFADNSYDIVCAFDVIEHILEDQQAIDEALRVLKPKGHLLITVPAFLHLWSHHDVVNEHHRRYTMRQVLHLFKNKEGKMVRKTYFNSLLYLPILLFRVLSSILPEKDQKGDAGSDFTAIDNESLINKLFYFVFNFERKLLRRISFPVGVSILALWKNKQDTTNPRRNS